MREKEGLAQTILALLVISSSRATRKCHLLLRDGLAIPIGCPYSRTPLGVHFLSLYEKKPRDEAQ